MTIKDLFNLAVAKGLEDAEILVNYECDDYWYSFEGFPIEKDNLSYNKDWNEIYINL